MGGWGPPPAGGTEPARSTEELPHPPTARSPLAAPPSSTPGKPRHSQAGEALAMAQGSGSRGRGRGLSSPGRGSHLYRGSRTSVSRVPCRTQGLCSPTSVPGAAHGLAAAALERTVPELAPGNCPTPRRGGRGGLRQGRATFDPFLPRREPEQGREGWGCASLLFQQQESKHERAGGSNKPQARPALRKPVPPEPGAAAAGTPGPLNRGGRQLQSARGLAVHLTSPHRGKAKRSHQARDINSQLV